MKRDITDKFLYADRSGKPDGIVSIFVKLTFAAAVFFISSTVNAEFSYSVPAVADNDCMIQEIQTPDSFDTQDIFNTAPTIRDRALKRNNTRRQNKTYLFTAPADFFPTESIFSPKKSIDAGCQYCSLSDNEKRDENQPERRNLFIADLCRLHSKSDAEIKDRFLFFPGIEPEQEQEQNLLFLLPDHLSGM